MRNIEYYQGEYDKIFEKATNLLRDQPANREKMSRYMRRLNYLKGIIFALKNNTK
jgi:hypothetical protein